MLIKRMTIIDVTDEEGNSRTITAANLSWMLGAGWMFYFCSMFLNYLYYKMHPSSPEMWTCMGTAEDLEEWTPPGETQTTQEEGELGLKVYYRSIVKFEHP